VRWLLLALALSACRKTGGGNGVLLDGSSGDAAHAPITAGDLDGDRLTNTDEATLAQAYLPFLSLAPDDACPTNGLVVRVTPAEIAGLVRIRYVWLFDEDCDVGQQGVDGSIALLVDPTKPSPGGIVGLRTVARPGSFCQQISTCGTCSGQLACEDLGGVPAVWAARDRHAIYATKTITCIQTGACMAECADATQPAMPPLVNVGEPDVPLVHDLTTGGFITSANGWKSMTLYDYDPWGGASFGDAAPVSSLLDGQDPPNCPSP